MTVPGSSKDYHQTATELKNHDNLLKFGMFATGVLTALRSKRIGPTLATWTAYYSGMRHLTHDRHQRALDEAERLSGKRPQDPYPGFWGSSELAQDISTSIERHRHTALNLYEESGAKAKVEQFLKKFIP